MTRNKGIQTALTETKHCSQCTVGVVYCVLNNRQGLNYYEGRYERNGDGNLIDIAVWPNLVVTALTSAPIARNSTINIPSLRHKMLAITLPTTVCTFNLYPLPPLPPDSDHLAPSASIFFYSWRMHTRTPFIWRRRAANSARVKSSDASANSFVRPAHKDWRKVGKNVLIMKEIVRENYPNF